ncbi:MAG: hypothetical protein HQK58_13530 [Deltaproteobacteria bacterium]|nr:hypothetical protein [Deltaproteobacteria bacterium]
MNDAGGQFQFNPFASQTVGDPWEDKEIPDVKTINEKPFKGLLGVLKQIKKTPRIGALVFGESGFGKTSLIKRFTTEPDLNLIFVYVRPLKDHTRVFTSLLETVVANLDSPPPGLQEDVGWTQLDLMVSNVLKSALVNYAKRNPKNLKLQILEAIIDNPLSVLDWRKASKWNIVLTKTKEFLEASGFPKDDTSKMVLGAFFQYIDSSKRDAVRAFMSGCIPEVEDCELLGFKPFNGDLPAEALEDRSRTILKAIGKLLSYHCPMIICFDQLENLITPAQASGFGEVIIEIVDQTKNILPVAFARPDTWLREPIKNLFHPAKRRLESNTFNLDACTVDQKLEIVRQRLLWAFDGAPEEIDSLISYQSRALTEGLIDSISPGDVINKAKRLLGGVDFPASIEDISKPLTSVQAPAPAPVPPAEVLNSFFRKERERLLTAKLKEPTKREIILEALCVYFANRGPATPYQVNKLTEDAKVGLTIKIISREPGAAPKTIDFLMETAVHWQSLKSAFQRLRCRIKDGAATCSFFLRDSRAQIPTKPGGMPKTVVERDEFLKAGGALEYMEVAHLADLQALVYTANAVGSGDISYTNESGERQEVDRDIFNAFVRDSFTSEFIANLERQFLTCPAACAPPPPRTPPADCIEQILAILKTTPFKYRLENIALALENRYKIILSHDELAVCIGKHAEKISQIPISPPIYYLRPPK